MGAGPYPGTVWCVEWALKLVFGPTKSFQLLRITADPGYTTHYGDPLTPGSTLCEVRPLAGLMFRPPTKVYTVMTYDDLTGGGRGEISQVDT